MMQPQEEASETYPSVSLENGYRLHVYQDGEYWCAWLNTEIDDFDGLCIGTGKTRDETLRAAVAVLESAVDRLQEPEATFPRRPRRRG